MSEEEASRWQLGKNAAQSGPPPEQADQPQTGTKESAPADTSLPQGQNSPDELRRLGADLASAMQEGGYHPVILFGTNFSGKTSLLLSLFSSVMSEPTLQTGLFLANPLLGMKSSVGSQLHAEARHTFEVKTQAFREGEKIPKTNITLPFFIPVEFRPKDKVDVRFAFLESNGEWYRPNRTKGSSLATAEKLFPELRSEIEDFIATFQGPITFLYLAPATQGEVYSDRDNPADADELLNASLAITGVIRAYDKIRANYRSGDFHLMLVSKWDEKSKTDLNRSESIHEDRELLDEFVRLKYADALSSLQGLQISHDQRALRAYCAGIINERGLLQLRHDDDLRVAILGYPVRVWKLLYSRALLARDLSPESPFPEPKRRSPIMVALQRVLDAFTS